MRVLVLAEEKVDAAAVKSALPGEDLEGAEILVVSPAEESNPVKFLVSDVDEAIHDAEETAVASAEALRDAGAHARVETGEGDPLLAIQDALASFPADKIVVIGDDDVAAKARERFDVPVSSA